MAAICAYSQEDGIGFIAVAPEAVPVVRPLAIPESFLLRADEVVGAARGAGAAE